MTVNLTDEIQNYLDEYAVEVQDNIEEVAKSVAQLGAKELRAKSPKDKGDYAKSWSSKKQGTGLGNTSYVIYNRRYPGLAHLIENGHIIRNQYGTYGRVTGRPHIKPVEVMVNEKFVDEVVKAIKITK